MPIQSSTHFLGILGVLAASLLWGTTGTAAAFAPEVSAAAIAAAVMGGGGLLQALRGLPLIRRNRALLKRHSALLLSAGLSVALYPIAFYGSMRLAGVTLGTVISIGAAPLFSGAIEWAAEGKAPGVRWGAGVAAGIIGILLITLESGAETASGTALHPVAGVLAALAAAFTYAYYSYAARRLMLSGIPSRAAMGAEFGIGALLLLPVLLATGSPFLHSVQNAAVGLYMAVVPMFIGYICFGYGLERVRASTAIAISLLEPVVAALLAAAVLGERLSLPAYAGIALIFASLALFTFTGKKSG